MIETTLYAWTTIFSMPNFAILLVAILVGTFFGAVPGLGGITAMTIILPFVFGITTETTVILLIGISAVISTADTIPAVMMGVPGTVGAQATIMDGFPMAKKGEVGRAFGAAYSSSMLGGVIGVAALLLSLPILQPLVLVMGSPELFMISMLGVTMIGVLSAKTPLVGLMLGLAGILFSMVGQDPHTGIYKWTFGQPYLLEGFPLVPVILGMFAIPELLDLVSRRDRIASAGTIAGIGADMLRGIRDSLRNWFLVLRCSLLGVLVGITPGLGSQVVDWIAYGHVAQSVKDPERLGKGDVRGVIGPESANNAKVGGALIPTIAFGVPGSAQMIILLGALTMAGVFPGPEMITRHLNITMIMIWTLFVATILGGLLMFLITRYVARLCYSPVELLAPIILVAVMIAALQATIHVADIAVLLAFGLLGWMLLRAGWPRPPFVLGFILGPIASQYLFISIRAYEYAWLLRPGVLVIGGLLAALVGYTVWKSLRSRRLREGWAK